jgi:integrating conjugative element relaxase (TIGR03760 family)
MKGMDTRGTALSERAKKVLCWLFQRQTHPVAADPPVLEPSKGWIRPEPAAQLLATPKRKRLLEHIWQRTSVSRPQFARLYQVPLEKYAELVQQFPASESHHHAYLGGLLDHGLEIVVDVLKLRQSHLLPVGALPETQAAQSEAWTAALAYAALVHDLGKIAVDIHVEYEDGALWHPWHGPLERPYRFRYREGREYRLHGVATGLLTARLLDRFILDWLCGYPELWTALLYTLAGRFEHAGILGELVMQADQASVARALGGDPAKALRAPRHALQRKLLDGLRYLVREAFKLNQPQASDGWLTQDALWLVSKTVADKLRAHLLSQGIDGIPSNNSTLFDVLQEHGMILPTPDGKAIWRASVTSDTGWSHEFTFLRMFPASIWDTDERPAPFAGVVRESAGASREERPLESPVEIMDSPVEETTAHMETVPVAPIHETLPAMPDDTDTENEAPGEQFVAWLRQAVRTRKIIINEAQAKVHTVADTVFIVSPGLFQRYAQEHPHIAALAKQVQLTDWQWVQKQFEKMGLHRKQANGLNIWTCEVVGPRKNRRLHGYLLCGPEVLFDETLPNNPYLHLCDSGSTEKGD